MVSGPEDFAALLGDLKERSGLSYGVLAKRLHVGTSTLHRYVQGETVPPEYGVIEKFARLTGASATEMATLYRLWMAAGEARSSTVAEAVSVVPPAPLAPPVSPVEDSSGDSSIATTPSPVPRKRRRLLPALAVLAVVGVGAAVAGVAFASSPGSNPDRTAASTVSSSTSSPLQSSSSLQSSPSASAPSNSSTGAATSSSASSTPSTPPLLYLSLHFLRSSYSGDHPSLPVGRQVRAVVPAQQEARRGPSSADRGGRAGMGQRTGRRVGRDHEDRAVGPGDVLEHGGAARAACPDGQ